MDGNGERAALPFLARHGFEGGVKTQYPKLSPPATIDGCFWPSGNHSGHSSFLALCMHAGEDPWSWAFMMLSGLLGFIRQTVVSGRGVSGKVC